ncbi:helix-turn-helix transcriptional regulator [Candidatus Nucleicultrix amoebiphila]|uniref:Helix-turn-helix domain-containing protein n=1 Tax=Candidatus Nucleicultrix amoebiphila FS5 TaxID=1414854 RepID=A0A1W6N4E7_9PROT|nr:helix-turn-helix domain-containing protein [Candidatus Nucleicultrix amoebiphila]ARN84767.1 hypothetical protein GQ61_05055 [Candidatus Nucleicultrix amoebiphila FS5]
METPLLTQEELAKRWNLSTITLSQWRWNGQGPKHVKIGRQSLYRLDDVEQFEELNTRRTTSESVFKTLPAHF